MADICAVCKQPIQPHEPLVDSYDGALFRPESEVTTCHLRCLGELLDMAPVAQPAAPAVEGAS